MMGCDLSLVLAEITIFENMIFLLKIGVIS